MPKIYPPVFVEGDVLEKKDITGLRDSIKSDLNTKVDELNIREEGLDRRVFADGAIVPKYDETQKVYANEQGQLYSHANWHRIHYADFSKVKGKKLHPSNAAVGIEWDPEIDTHCVIRFSAFVDTRPYTHKPKSVDTYWDFGLVIIPPGGGSLPDTPTTGFISDVGSEGLWHRVSPYQRVGLNQAFTYRSGAGYWNKSQSEGLDSSWSTIDSDYERRVVDSDAPEIIGYHVDTYPRGAWYQYPFSRRTNLNATISMTAHATSERSRTVGSHFKWTEKGTASVYAVYRSNATVDPPSIYIDNFNLSYQKYRR